jgi:flagellar protein FliO/FliZ
MKRFAPLALASLAVAPALAAGEPAGVSPSPLLGALVVVVAAIFVTAFLYKRLGPRLPGGSSLLKSVATLPLGPRERLVVVRVADRWLVLGVTAQSIQPLADLEAKELPPEPAGKQPFAGALARALRSHEER